MSAMEKKEKEEFLTSDSSKIKSQVYREEVYRQFGLDSFKKNWFTENGTLAGDYALSIEVKNVMHREKSKYQDILVFESKKFGRCLALENGIQLSEKDEFAYHEMITFLPLNSHPNPAKVLIIGGGDGGIVRDASKHPLVHSITLCEIDEAVISVCKKYLPFVAKGFDSPKLTVLIGDGFEFVKNKKDKFDVIIIDSPDPIGPAAVLYEKQFLELLKDSLNPGGIVASQGECFWFDTYKTREFLDTYRSVFPVVDYAASLVPSFPAGQIGIVLAATSDEINFREPLHKFTSQTMKDLGLRFYTPDVHRSAFALPISISKELGLQKDLFSH